VLVNPNLKNQRNEAQMQVKNAQTAVSIPLGESKQLSPYFLLAFVLRCVGFSDLETRILSSRSSKLELQLLGLVHTFVFFK